jgi:hypothetical protein
MLWGGIIAGGSNSAIFCKFEQLNALAAMTRTPRRCIRKLPKPSQAPNRQDGGAAWECRGMSGAPQDIGRCRGAVGK